MDCAPHCCSGFGFITFKEADSVQAVLDQHNKEAIVIDEKTVRAP